MYTARKPIAAAVVSAWLAAAGVSLAPPADAKQPVPGLTGQAAGQQSDPTTAPNLTLFVNGRTLPVDLLYRFIEAGSYQVVLHPDARRKLQANADKVRQWCDEGKPIYGVTAALGPLKDVKLTCADTDTFAKSTLRSNAAGLGEAFPPAVVRLTMLLRVNMAANGHFAGVRPELAERYLEILNAGIVPHMTTRGSLGIGDLQSQADLGLVLIGDEYGKAALNSKAALDNEWGPAPGILVAKGLQSSFRLAPGEALAILSGNTVVTAGAAWILHRARHLLDALDLASSMFMEATRAKVDPLDARIHQSRNIPGQIQSAWRMRSMLCGSQWTTDAGRARLGETVDRVQDSTVVRATSQINGGLREAVAYLERIVERETNASASNPLVFENPPGSADSHDVLSGGNWDGTVLALGIDHLSAAVTAAAVASERRSSRLISPQWSKKLPASLTGGKPGLNNGYIQVQSLQLSVVTEMRLNAYPSAVLSVPAKNYQEDTNSMANNALLVAAEQLGRAEEIVALEILMAGRAIALIKPKMGGLALGKVTGPMQEFLEKEPLSLTEPDDIYLGDNVANAVELVHGRRITSAVRALLGGNGGLGPDCRL